MRQDSWLKRVMRRNAAEPFQSRRLRGLPYPHSQAVKVAPAYQQHPRESLPNVNPVPLSQKPHLRVVARDGETQGEPHETYDRLHVSDEIEPTGAQAPTERSRFDIRVQTRVLDYKAKIKREAEEGGV